MQFDTTVNDWHPCPNTARINASNPCSEYMFLDDSAVQPRVAEPDEVRRRAGRVRRGGVPARGARDDHRAGDPGRQRQLPTRAIERNSHDYRPLGLGYANLGALLMSRGLPYDSDEGRDFSATVTAIMHGEAYAQSARVSRDHGGPFAGYEKNREPFPARHAEAPRRAEGHQPDARAPRALRGRQEHVGTSASSW